MDSLSRGQDSGPSHLATSPGMRSRQCKWGHQRRHGPEQEPHTVNIHGLRKVDSEAQIAAAPGKISMGKTVGSGMQECIQASAHDPS